MLSEGIVPIIDGGQEIDRGGNDEVVVKLQGAGRIICRAHYFMELFSRPYPHYFRWKLRRHGLCKINDADGRNFRDKQFALLHPLEGFQYEVDSLGESNDESCHAFS